MDIFFFRKLPRLNSFYPNLTYYRNTKIMLTNCRWWLMSRMTLVMAKWRLNWKWDRRCKKFLFKFLLIMFWNFLVESFGLWKILSKKSPKKRQTAAGKYYNTMGPNILKSPGQKTRQNQSMNFSWIESVIFIDFFFADVGLLLDFFGLGF